MKTPPRRVHLVDTMRTGHLDDELEIRWLILDASSTWTGPSPRQDQSRWAAPNEGRRRLSGGVRFAAYGVAYTVVVFVGVMLAATAVSPGSPAKSVTTMMSHVFAGSVTASPNEGPAKSSPSASPGQAGRQSESRTSDQAESRSRTSPAPRESEGPSPLPSRAPSPQPSHSPGP